MVERFCFLNDAKQVMLYNKKSIKQSSTISSSIQELSQ
jgi:hypothetical protein